MATKAKPATKSTKISSKKTTVTKKPPTKSRKKATAKEQPVKSFHVAKEKEGFFNSRITLQTVYWSVFSIAILLLALWILNVQLDIIELLEQIQRSNMEDTLLLPTPLEE